MKNFIGIDQQEAEKLNTSLNQLLANYQVYYQNLRGFHWNIQGSSFFELHMKFEELYNQAATAIDEIAERILTLDGQPLHTFSDYLETAEIKPVRNVVEAKESVQATVENLSVLIQLERQILEAASNASDEGSVDLMSTYLTQQEKVVWMLNAYLK